LIQVKKKRGHFAPQLTMIKAAVCARHTVHARLLVEPIDA
jgi:hypothetical protein